MNQAGNQTLSQTLSKYKYVRTGDVNILVMLPFFMHGDGWILSEADLQRYSGTRSMDKYQFVEGTTEPTITPVTPDTSVEDLKQWLRPTRINNGDVERWRTAPTLRILMIKTQNQFSRTPDNVPSHRTIPGATEIEPLPDKDLHVKVIREIFRHTRLPLAALGGFIKSHITFLSAPSYEILGEEGGSGGECTKYYCSGTSWSIAWCYFHATRHTVAVLFYREGDGEQRRLELEQEIKRLRKHIAHPLLLGFIKTQVSLVWTFNLLEQMNGQVFEVEKNVGLDTWDWVLDREISAYRPPDKDQFDEHQIAKAQKYAIQRYNVLSSKLINIIFRLRTFREQISWLRRVNQTYRNSLAAVPGLSLKNRTKECHELDIVLDRMDDFSKVYLHDADTLGDRLSQQMSAMSYLINQRDFRISLKIAEVNNELAWQGKNTNAAMMAIAVASFIFLPGTFIASVFDTPIFNWTPRDDEVVVKEPFWIYWLTCGLTTLLLSGCWLIYVKKQHAADEDRRNQAREDFFGEIFRAPTISRRTGTVADDNGKSNLVARIRAWTSRISSGDEEAGLGAAQAANVRTHT